MPDVAFPGALGWAAPITLATSRALPLAVHFVTNTNSSGSGSFAAALTACRSDRYDIIIFRTGGTIDTSGLVLNVSHVYIAGQTAPGGGIAFGSSSGHLLEIRGSGANVTDIVIRGIRFRGATNQLLFRKGLRWIVDQCSFAGSGNMQFYTNQAMNSTTPGDYTSTSDAIEDGTIQRCLFAWATSINQPTGIHYATSGDAVDPPVIGHERVAFVRNLLAHVGWRGPYDESDHSIVANNVNYNWLQGVTQIGRRGDHDVLYNIGVDGPMTAADQHCIVTAECQRSTLVGGEPRTTVYATGNMGPTNSWDPTSNNETDAAWRCYRNTPESGDRCVDGIPEEWKRETPLTQPYSPLTTYEAVWDAVVTGMQAGAVRRINPNGDVVLNADARDTQYYADVNNGTGPSSVPSSFSTPSLSAGVAPTDTGMTGLPNEWRQRYFGTLDVEPDAVGADGYLMIEHYINGTNPGEPEPEPPEEYEATFEGGIYVYLTPLVGRATAAGGTVPTLGPSTAVVPLDVPNISVRPPGHHSVLVGAAEDLGAPLEAEAVDAIMAEWWPSDETIRADRLRDLFEET